MRRLLFIFLSLLSIGFYGQSDTTKCRSILDTLTNTQVYSLVDNMPEVEGGFQKLMAEIQKKVHYPGDDSYNTGKVVVAFIIKSNGQIVGKRIVRDPTGNKLGNQVLAIIDNVKWISGSCRNKKVDVILNIPLYIDFQ
jgi:hypothetical protein